MILKYKIIDPEVTATSNRLMYIVVKYNINSKEFTFGGRAINMDFMLETIQKLFELESEHIEPPAFNQKMNIRWEVKSMDYDHFDKCMTMLKGNYYFKLEKVTRLNRLM